MTPDDPSLADCLARLEAGDQEAARQIYERFVGRLVQVAAGKLDRRLGAKADPETVAHSAFESFFVRHRAGTIEVHNWGMVFGLLAHITARKALNRNRDLRRKRRDEADVVSFDDWKAVDKNPGPEDEAAVAELLDLAFRGYDADERAVVESYLGGASAAAVAQQVGLSTRTVQRVLERFKSRLKTLLEQD